MLEECLSWLKRLSFIVTVKLNTYPSPIVGFDGQIETYRGRLQIATCEIEDVPASKRKGNDNSF